MFHHKWEVIIACPDVLLAHMVVSILAVIEMCQDNRHHTSELTHLVVHQLYLKRNETKTQNPTNTESRM